MDLNNVWMRRQDCHDLGFVLETLAVSGIGEEVLVDDFTGEEFVLDGGEAARDCAKSAAANLLADVVVVLQGVAHFPVIGRGFWFGWIGLSIVWKSVSLDL